MKSIIFKLAILSFVLFAITGCSKGGSDPVQPDAGASNPPVLRMASGRNLIGVWEIHLRGDVPGADVRINRSVQSHVNVVEDQEYEDFEVDVDYDAGEDYNPNFGFRDWAIWRLTIILTNDTDEDLYDVRGIIRTNDNALGLHNADGLTTIWDNSGEGDDINPFKYYGEIQESEVGTEEFHIQFEPTTATLDCSNGSWTTPKDPENPGDYILLEDQEIWINFAVDASVGGYCLEPYSIDGTAVFSGDLDEPVLTITVDAYVHPPSSSVDTISIMLIDLPGYEEDWGEWLVLSPYSSITLDGIGAQTHEGIYHARIRVTSTEPSTPDPYDDPNTMYKDIRLLVGDFDELIEDMFTIDLEFFYLYLEVLEEWEDREPYIYTNPQNDGFEIKGHYFDDEFYVLIQYNVWDPVEETTIPEFGALRIPPNDYYEPPPTWTKPTDGWPMMVFCHFGRAVSEAGCGEDFFTQQDNLYKSKFAELIPRYRGNALCWDGSLYNEEGYEDDVNSPADWDVDDVLTFLNVVINREDDIREEIEYSPCATGKLFDETKTGIMGGSRGGSPTYLAKIRDSLSGANQIGRALITIGSVTDFLLEEEDEGIVTSCEKYIEYDGYIPDDIYHYYLADYNVFKRVLKPYLDGELSFEDARKRLIRSSPYYFANSLGKVQVHHGMQDLLARPAQTAAWLEIFNQVEGTTEFHLYLGAGHNIGLTDYDPVWDNETYEHATGRWLQYIIDGE